MEDSPLNGSRRSQPWKLKRSLSNSTAASAITAAKRQQLQQLTPWQLLWRDVEKTLGMHGVRRIKPRRRNVIARYVFFMTFLQALCCDHCSLTLLVC